VGDLTVTGDMVEDFTGDSVGELAGNLVGASMVTGDSVGRSVFVRIGAGN